MGKKMGKGSGAGAGGGGRRRSQADERGAATKSNWIRFKNPTPDHVRRPSSSHPSLSSAWFPFSPLLFSRNPAANVLFLLLHCLGFFPIGFLLFKLTLVLHLPPSSIHPLVPASLPPKPSLSPGSSLYPPLSSHWPQFILFCCDSFSVKETWQWGHSYAAASCKFWPTVMGVCEVGWRRKWALWVLSMQSEAGVANRWENSHSYSHSKDSFMLFRYFFSFLKFLVFKKFCQLFIR